MDDDKAILAKFYVYYTQREKYSVYTCTVDEFKDLYKQFIRRD